MTEKPKDLCDAICHAVDQWHESHPDLMVSEILDAMEEIRCKLQDALDRKAPKPLRH